MGVALAQPETLLASYARRIVAAKVYELAHRTPLELMEGVSETLGREVWIKREDWQKGFSFKLRGAVNVLAQMPEAARAHGVVAASAGNHARGVALAAKHYGVQATIVMPKTTPQVKVDATAALGAKVILHGDFYDEAQAYAETLAKKRQARLIHPFDDPDVIAGQGTIGMEILAQLPSQPEAIFVPVGGGGLIAGIGAYVKHVSPQTKVIGVEPEGAESLYTALKFGKRVCLPQVNLFADGVAVKQVGEENFRLAQACVDEVILVSNDAICAAAKSIFEHSRTVVEPSGALALAGLMRYAERHGKESGALVAVCSGANINFNRIGDLVERAELGAAREALFAVSIPEIPGSFLSFCQTIGQRSVTEFNYRYGSADSASVLVGLGLSRGEPEKTEVMAALAQAGYAVTDLTHNEFAKDHLRHLVGGRAALPERERIFRFAFPERVGALLEFLMALKGRWSISLFHYRNHGQSYGKVLAGFFVPEAEEAAFFAFLKETGYPFTEETENPAYRAFCR